jgi:predicted hydrolase (HD superfamily)
VRTRASAAQAGRLDEKERALIETHPAAGYDVLNGTAGISPEILDAVRHHEILLDMKGKLEMPLVNAFREVALKR